MSTIDMLKKILDACWTVEISIGEDCDYIFAAHFNNQPEKSKFRTGKVGTFGKCMRSFYSEWLTMNKRYWKVTPKQE